MSYYPSPSTSIPANKFGRSRLEAKGLSIGYGANLIVENIDFSPPDSALTVLIGANGCGKSTLFKALSRVLSPRGGSVFLDGRDLGEMRTTDIAKKLALLPQGPIAPEGLTVRDLVAQGRYPHQTLLRQWSATDAQAVLDAMQAADVEQFSDRRLTDLSGGQRQRCWIAMVLAQDTDIILLDEPTTFLDLKVQIDVMSLLTRVAHEQNRTLVVVLHELNIAAAFADHLVMMRDGQIIAQGSVEDTFTEENLAAVFDIDAAVIPDPSNQRPICVPRLNFRGAQI